MGETDIEKAGGFGDDLILKTDLLVAETLLSPLEITRARRSGRMEFAGAPDGSLALEVGGRVIATGRIVKRGGHRFFKVQKLFGENQEAQR